MELVRAKPRILNRIAAEKAKPILFMESNFRPTKGTPKVQEKFVTPIKAMIEENPSFGYRTVAHLLGMSKNTVQRVFQCMGWQVRKRPVGFRPRIQALPSRALAPNERWATDLCLILRLLPLA